MPQLDSSALTSDPDGLEFLAQVLDVSPEARALRRSFDVPQQTDRGARVSRVRRASVRRASRLHEIA